jgi:hypothetical protein
MGMTPSEHQRHASSMLRSSAFAFGLCAAAYGALGVWLSHRAPEDPLKQSACALWLCPLEFSPERIYELETRKNNRAEAIAELKHAVQTEPASAYAWANLAEAFGKPADRRLAAYCMQRAIEAAPSSPAILMRASNLALIAGDDPAAAAYLNRVLREPDVTEFYPAVFLTYSRMPVPLRDVLARGVPPSAAVAEALLRYAIASPRSGDAVAAWQWIAQHRLESDELTRDYLTFLLSHGQEPTAAETWAALNAASATDYRRSNWIFNGAFETAPRPVPLDWQIDHTGDVEVLRSPLAPHDGKWSLELRFPGTENVQFEGVRQRTILSPGKWRVSAAIRTDGITTDEGVAIRVFDALQSRRLDVTTEALAGTHDWTGVERIFEVAPETRIVGVEVFRRSSQRFDSKIAGSAWVDSLELTPMR